ncbi:MAG: glutathione S-transferase family protein [Litoreibacter sp.]|uniref:glutathione S-transferase family protein n=1 Tax=Litoreibacter sp. TaxID=1969459 RepID=UPI0032981994
MLKIITFPTSFGEPSHSPFCVKAMVLLQMSGQRWEREDVSNPAPMPHGKLPVLRTGAGLVPDSEFIQEWLVEQGADFYPNCTDQQKAIGHSLVRLAEDNLRLALVHDRWLDEQCWPKIWPIFFAEVPSPIRKLIAHKARKSVKAALLSNGVARMSSEQRLKKVANDLDAIGRVLGVNDFILGGTPTGVDASVLPILSMIDRLPAKTELRVLLRRCDWVENYLQRGRDALYSDLVG